MPGARNRPARAADRNLMAHCAETAASIDPVLLNEEIAGRRGRGQTDVRLGAIWGRVGSSKGPRALIRVLVAATVVPGVQIGIGRGFLQFMRDDGRHSVRAGIAIGTGGLCFACTRASVRV